MAQFAGGNGAFTPATTNDCWTLQATAAGQMGKIKSFGWGGRGTTSIGYRTRWVRPTTDPTGAATTITASRTSPLVAPLLTLASTYATTQPTLPADPIALWAQDWNVQGGGGVVILPIGGEWFCIFSATAGHSLVSCRNIAGTDANLSSYDVTWEE